MKAAKDPRAALSDARRIVVKIGSRAITQAGRFQALADQIALLQGRGHTVVLVSSGAVAMGLQHLGLSTRPQAVPELQAAAAIGQPRLIVAYEQAFSGHGLAVAQVLLTHADFPSRTRYFSARRTINALIRRGAVAIVNENDTVSTKEMRFGDNDQLAALVAGLVGADLLVLLTDVAGLLDAHKQRVPLVEDVAAIRGMIWQERSGVSLGGMASKVSAAENALKRGRPVVMAAADAPEVLVRIVAGEDVGTLFLPADRKLSEREYWIAHTLRVRGTLVVDAGAARALCEQGASLLPVGIAEVKGEFRAREAVNIVRADGSVVARGLVRYDGRDVRELRGAGGAELKARLKAMKARHGVGPDEKGYDGHEIVHRDDLVVL